MADDLTDAIESSAEGPRSASGDSGSMSQHPLPDLIEADKYLAAKQAVATRTRGLRLTRLAATGT